MSFAGALETQTRVVGALVLRETRTRFGKHHLGYLWAFIEPSLWVLTFAIMFSVGGRAVGGGFDIIAFLVTGIVPYLLFNSTSGKAGAAIDANRALLFYPLLRPLDFVIARVLLEAATMITVFWALSFANMLLFDAPPPEDVLRVMLALLLASALGAGLGLSLCGLSVYSNAVQRLQGPLMRPLFWTSGLFFTANDLPRQVRELLLYNPVLHVVELARDGWSSSYASLGFSGSYVIAWVLGLLFLGLTLERTTRGRERD